VKQDSFEYQLFWGASILSSILTLVWCCMLGAGNIEKTSLALAVCSSTFAVGSLIGFFFTIFGDELEPLGKIRDAMIALASGIAGIGLANAKKFAVVVGGIHILSNDLERSPSFSVLFALSYFVAGFYFMYLMRKLILNPALAKSRIAMERIQISGSAGTVAIMIGEKLPQSFLLGREFIEDDLEEGGEKAQLLRSDLFSDDVEKFLANCEEDAKTGSRIQPESVAMAARLHYYRVYLEKEDGPGRSRQQEKALEWMQRALMRDPTNPDFQIKLADIFWMQDRDDEAISIFERLERDDDAPQYIQQWLGFYLLDIDGRERDAIKHSLEFHKRFPDESSGLFNASRGYAQLYTRELREQGLSEIPTSENRLQSIVLLKQSVRLDPEFRALARKRSARSESFESLSSDVEFLEITADTKPKRPETR
jgi:tetratricopeptide (TPR) repeat protein